MAQMQPEPVGPVKLDYATPASPGRRGLWFGIAVAALGLGVLFIAAVDPWFSLGPSRERANRVKCASGLRMIGQAMHLYANDHGGVFPPSLGHLLHDGFDPRCLICPSSNDVTATGPTTQAIVAQVARPGFCSYVYAGAGLTANTPPSIWVAYERLSNHGDGINVLHCDGSVVWYPAATARAMLANMGATTRPAGGMP